MKHKDALVVGDRKPDHWLDCRQCGTKAFVVATVTTSWQCLRCRQRYQMFRSGKVYKMIESERYWAEL